MVPPRLFDNRDPFLRTLCIFAVALALACAAEGPTAAAEQGGLSAAPSRRPGMGAVVYPGGTAFRVWAPFADKVFVAGDFNGWSDGKNELAPEGNGNFSSDLAGAAAGQHYQYVIHHGGQVLWRSDPRAAQMVDSANASVIHDPAAFHWSSAPGSLPPFNELVVYELHLGTFAATGDGQPGTFRGALGKLDHLAQLGVNAVELMPFAEFAGSIDWGYTTSYPFAPESSYGSPEDLKALVDGAHQRGIAVIADVVHNHYGPNDLSMWNFDGESLGAGGSYFFTDWRSKTPWGNTRPDYGRPQIRDFIVDSVRTWLDEYRMDGARWDATFQIRAASGIPLPEGLAVLQAANGVTHSRASAKISIAEDFRGSESITLPADQGGSGFDAQWDSDFFHPVVDAVVATDDGARNMGAVAAAIRHLFGGKATKRVIYTESHDEVANGRQRVPEMIWPGNAASQASRKRSTLAAALVFTSPGIPMIFQGQEFLEDGYFTAARPLDWTKEQRFSGIELLYRDLIHLRRDWQGNTRGLRGDGVNVFHVDEAQKLLAFHRWDRGGRGDDVVVLANFSQRAFPAYRIGFPRGGTWHVRLNSDARIYGDDFGAVPGLDTTALPEGRDGLAWAADVGIGPYSVVILSQ